MRHGEPYVCAMARLNIFMQTTRLGRVQRREFIKSMLSSALLWKAPALLALQGSPNPPAPDPGVKRVLVMFKCHFDAGFADTQAAIVRRYFTEYFPQAMDLATQLRQSGNQRYVWTTGSWLLYEYLEQATSEQRYADGEGHLRGRHRMARASLQLADRVDGRVDDLRKHRSFADAGPPFWPNHDRRQDDRCAWPHPRAGRSTRRSRREVSGYWRERCEHAAGSSLPCFSGRPPAGRRWWSCTTTATAAVVRVPGSDLAIAMVVRDDDSGPHTPARDQ